VVDLTWTDVWEKGQPKLRVEHRTVIVEPGGAPSTYSTSNLVESLKNVAKKCVPSGTCGWGGMSVAVTRSSPAGGRELQTGGPVTLQAVPTWIAYVAPGVVLNLTVDWTSEADVSSLHVTSDPADAPE
jgi:hypothetical protein